MRARTGNGVCNYCESAQLKSMKKDTTHSGTHSAINGNDDTHNSVTEDTSTDSHFHIH